MTGNPTDNETILEALPIELQDEILVLIDNGELAADYDENKGFTVVRDKATSLIGRILYNHKTLREVVNAYNERHRLSAQALD